MSLFADDFSASAEEHLAYFGAADRLTYTPPGGCAVALTAVIGKERATENHDKSQERERRLKFRERKITIHRDPASSYGGVAEPALNAVVTVDGVVYHVHAVAVIDEHLVMLTIRRSEAMEISRPQHRR